MTRYYKSYKVINENEFQTHLDAYNKYVCDYNEQERNYSGEGDYPSCEQEWSELSISSSFQNNEIFISYKDDRIPAIIRTIQKSRYHDSFTENYYPFAVIKYRKRFYVNEQKNNMSTVFLSAISPQDILSIKVVYMICTYRV